MAVPELVFRNTFAVHGERSNETSNEGSNERSNELSNESERSLDRAPLNTSYAHVTHAEEDWWTGTD